MSLNTKLLSHPCPVSPLKANKNIFAPDPQIQKQLIKQEHLPSIYDFVGPSSLRNQLLTQKMTQSKQSLQSLSQLQQKRNITKQAEQQNHPSLRATMLRSTIMSKMTRSQIKQLTRDRRNMQFFKVYEDRWSKQNQLTKRRVTLEKLDKPTLLERSKKKLQVMPNPEKQDILKNYVTSYWEMSLRNHNPTLKQHIKGFNQYNQEQLEIMLQQEQGFKQIQRSMPRLPVQKLSQLNPKQLMLSGRNKLAKESASCDPSIVSQYTERRSGAQSDLGHHQTWKAQYDAHHRYMAESQC